MKKLFYILLALVFSASVYADITPLPDPPSRAEPSTFADKADAFLGALPTFATEANQLASDVNDDATAAAASAVSAASSASSALTAANFEGEWSDQTGAAAIPYTVSHEGNFWTLIQNLADVTTQEPGNAPTYWVHIGNYLNVATLSDLQALTVVEGAVVYLRGRTSDGDGGQGFFVGDETNLLTECTADTLHGVYVHTTGDDGTNGAWVRQYNGVLNLLWFGSNTSPGTTDLATAVQAAIDFIFASVSAPSELIFPGEDIYIGSKITKTVGSSSRRAVIRGTGNKTIIYSGVIGDSTLELIDAQKVIIRDLRFIGNDLTGSNGNGHALALRDSAVESGTYYPAQCAVINCDISYFRGTDVDDDGNSISAAGIYIGNGLGTYIDRCTVANCGHNFYAYKSRNCFLKNSVLSLTDKWGVVLDQVADGFTIDKCDIIGGGAIGSETPVAYAPFCGAYCKSTKNVVNILNSKFKGGYAEIVLSGTDTVNIRGCFIEPPDKTTLGGTSGIYGVATRITNVENNNFQYIATVGALNNYTSVYLDKLQNTKDFVNNIRGNRFIHADNVDQDIRIDGNGAGNVTIDISGNLFGVASPALPAYITDCILLESGTYAGAIQNNTFMAGDASGSGSVITNCLSLSGATFENMSVGRNSNATYLTGTITNSIGVTEKRAYLSDTTDASGDIIVTHGLVTTPTQAQITVFSSAFAVGVVRNFTATTFTVRFLDAAGAAFASSTINFCYTASVN